MASSTHEPSVAELRRDADRTRAHLTGTVEELRSQVADTATHMREAVAPATIKRQVKEYVRESSDDMMQSLQRRVRENPLQAVAIGAGIAYPLWNLVRAIPAPLLLIGAGLALSRSSAVREATDEAIARTREMAADAAQTTRHKMDEWRETADSVMDRASDMVTSTKQRVSGAVTDAQDRLSATVTDTQARASNLASDAQDSVADHAHAALNRGRDALDAASDKMTSFAHQAKDTLGSAYEQNPLLIAGIGVAVGALIASSLPATKAENQLFGDASDKLRQRAADAVDQGIEAAKRTAGNVVDAATQEGLSRDGLSSAASDMTRKARSVAERGVEAVLGDTSTR